jgi:outer membrane protein TolC
LVVEQPIFNADAWLGRRAANRVADAAEQESARTRDDTRFNVVRAYFGAVLAQERVATLTIAQRAAREHLRQAELMARNGMVTPSDALLAAVKSGEVDVQLLEASGNAATAIRALATEIGTPADTSLSVPVGLPSLHAVRHVAEEALAATSTTARADVRASELARLAAADDAARARTLYLPRLNGFARYDWNSAIRPFNGEKNWTVGVIASWSPFSGAAEWSESLASAARNVAATALAEGRGARAAYEVSQATTALGSTLARADIASRAIQQSVDAHRIVSRRYTAGLATVVELLDVAAIETSARLADAAARHDVILAAAARRHALGLDPGTVRTLDTAPRDAVASGAP